VEGDGLDALRTHEEIYDVSTKFLESAMSRRFASDASVTKRKACRPPFTLYRRELRHYRALNGEESERENLVAETLTAPEDLSRGINVYYGRRCRSD